METPAHAITIWLEGNLWMLGLDNQILSINAGAAQNLQNVLVARVKKAQPNNNEFFRRMPAIDKRETGFRDENYEEKAERAAKENKKRNEMKSTREAEQRKKHIAERKKLTDAQELLAELGL